MVSRLLAVRSSAHPHELLVCLVAVLIGLYGLLDIDVSPAIVNTLPPMWRIVFFLVLVLGGVIGPLGLLWRDRLMGLLIERVGMVVLALGFTVYTVAIFATATSFVFGLLPLAFVVTTLLRIVQIGRHFKLLTSYYTDHPEAVPYAAKRRGGEDG